VTEQYKETNDHLVVLQKQHNREKSDLQAKSLKLLARLEQAEKVTDNL